MTGDRDLGGDTTAEAIVAFLQERGAASRPHAHGQTLLDHLIGTYAIVRRWGAPAEVQHAALLHSVYGTEAYHHTLLAEADRGHVRALAGERAELIAHRFGTTDRRRLFGGAHRWLKQHEHERDELDALILLHMANLADQARGPWLVRVRDLAELLHGSVAIDPPRFVHQLHAFEADDEERTLAAYRDTEDFALAAAACPVIGEPCLRLAQRARRQGDHETSRQWAQIGRTRLLALGTAWDKRRSFEEWLALADDLGPHDPGPVAGTGGATRFLRYVESFDGPRPGARYPGLSRRPFHDPASFPIAGRLEHRYAEIKAEIDRLAPRTFQREAEPIARTGDWDVAFLYERGKRNDEICAALPTVTSLIEADPSAIRTHAGLIYVSRMRPGTHIAAHTGPTNVRLRCHLGITTPPGDCALRVEHQTERWQAGRALVFDDSFEHEAWNRTDADRIVLIVDLWHPDLAPQEVQLLTNLHAYTAVHANRLSGYWQRNAGAAGAPS